VRIGSKPIAFVLEINGDFPRKLRGDELRVRQILNNILSNAIKYTRQGSVTLSMAWEHAANKGHGEEAALQEARLHFIVRDTGVGIRPEDMGKLFAEYAQLDGQLNREVEGTGLGLAIGRKLTEMMGGTIAVESEYGKGSTFSVSLVQGLVGSESIGEETAERLKQFQYISPKEDKDIERSWMPYGKVMVVDDVQVNLLVACGLLEPYGLFVDTAESGQEAIDLIQAGTRYDLVFMDHMMPGMDGIEAVRNIRAWEKGRGKGNTPIIALTANALAGNMEMFLSKGFNGFIPKPIDIFQIDEALNQWVRDKQSQETLQQAEEEKAEMQGAK
jgi:CheY-like chemotaxis protein